MTGDVDFYFIPLPPARGLVSAGKLAVHCRQRLEPRLGAARRADHRRGRLPEFRVQFLGRHVRARRHPEGDRRRGSTRRPSRRLNDPAVNEQLAKAGGDPLPMKPAAFDAFVKKEIDVNAVLVKAAKIQPN